MPVFKDIIWCYFLSTNGRTAEIKLLKQFYIDLFPNVKDTDVNDRKQKIDVFTKVEVLDCETVLKDCYMVHMHC